MRVRHGAAQKDGAANMNTDSGKAASIAAVTAVMAMRSKMAVALVIGFGPKSESLVGFAGGRLVPLQRFRASRPVCSG